ncbi:50S ribosomal protein L15 [Candidatus Parcubacteria bacterium]|nr:MAG: 50S ribosomal protein L15 [Candidatus Parcubacteria bacterium]
MQLHELRRIHKLRESKRVGRGGKKGTTSGRGTKGQKARAGSKIRPSERDVIKKLPKLRGITADKVRTKTAVVGVNLSSINAKFNEGSLVNPESIVKIGLVRKIKGRVPAIKILSDGDIKKKVTFQRVSFSEKAKEKVIKSGSFIK